MAEREEIQGNTEAVMTEAELYLPPWRDRLPSGELSVESYGPASPAALARQVTRYRDWSYRVATVSQDARQDGEAMRQYMRPDGGALREDVPDRERQVYLLVYEHGHSVRYVARQLEIKRESVRTYLRRLRERAEL